MNHFADAAMQDTLSLDQLLIDGPLPLPDVVRYAMVLAEELRSVHDEGRISGALSPSNITVTNFGLELTGKADPTAAITPYTAPEILQGHAPDIRGDIFAFGAIVHEMATGRRAFAGDNTDALAVSLTISDPPPCGIPAIDHLVSNCTAKDPAVRCQRMQKVILELKLLTFATPKTEVVTRQQSMTAALRAETQQLEDRVAGLLETHERALVDIQQTSGDAFSELRERLDRVEAEIAPLQARSALVESLCQKIMAHVEQVQKNIESIDERVNGMRDSIDVLSQGATALHDFVGARMHDFEQSLKTQRTAIASVIASQSQTDDLVEGLVGAVDLLHTIVLDPAENAEGSRDRLVKLPGSSRQEQPDRRSSDLELMRAV
jgi:serine/threonine protein kinase